MLSDRWCEEDFLLGFSLNSATDLLYSRKLITCLSVDKSLLSLSLCFAKDSKVYVTVLCVLRQTGILLLGCCILLPSPEIVN